MSYIGFTRVVDTTSFVTAESQSYFKILNPDGSAATAATASNSVSGLSQTKSVNSLASTNATVVKARSGYITSVSASNANAAVRYLKIYDKATAPTVGTDVPVLIYAIPAASSINVDLEGQRFANGIGFATTTGVADSDTGAVAANEVKVSVNYR